MSTPSAEPMPAWSERDRPTTYLIDVHTPDNDYATLPNSDNGVNANYLGWINKHKVSLHAAFRALRPTAVSRLNARSVDLNLISRTVADITTEEPYPLSRVVIDKDAEGLPPYQAALEDGLFEQSMDFYDGTTVPAQFECALHFIRLNQQYIEQARRTNLIDTCAFALGQAALGRTTFAMLEQTEDGTITHHWHGAVWQYKGKPVGELLNDASATKIAAEARRRMFVFTPGSTHPHPLIEAYRLPTGISPHAIGALALDVAGSALGKNGNKNIWRSLWEYISSGQQEAARHELTAIIAAATNNKFSLEKLESYPYTHTGYPLKVLEQIEECSGIDASMRPSHHLRKPLLEQEGHVPQYAP